MGTPFTGTRRRIDEWRPDEPVFWSRLGRRVARRNLAASIVSEHIGFSVWSLWPVLALFAPATTGLPTAGHDLFLLVTVATLAGAALRLPYSFAVLRFGGRTWTTAGSLALLLPLGLTLAVISHNDPPFWWCVVAAAMSGLGGANFASSMTNVTVLFPQRLQGGALGLNAGGGNIGVAAVQLAGLMVVILAGPSHAAVLVLVYLPLALLAAVLADRQMDDIRPSGAPGRALRAAIRSRETWLLSTLYIGTFGSFIGYGFAFGLVLRQEFGLSPLETMSYAFLGPLVGSLARPAGGALADRWGGARVTLAAFAGLAVTTLGLMLAAPSRSMAAFAGCFLVLFLLSGAGNGSAFKMIPEAFPSSERAVAGMVMGVTGAVGAVGGAAITWAFRWAYDRHGDLTPALLMFLIFYAACAAITWRRCGMALDRRPCDG